MEDKERLRIELVHKRDMKESGRTLAMIPEKIEGGQEAEDSNSDKKKHLAENLKVWADGLFTQEVLEEI